MSQQHRVLRSILEIERLLSQIFDYEKTRDIVLVFTQPTIEQPYVAQLYAQHMELAQLLPQRLQLVEVQKLNKELERIFRHAKKKGYHLAFVRQQQQVEKTTIPHLDQVRRLHTKITSAIADVIF